MALMTEISIHTNLLLIIALGLWKIRRAKNWHLAPAWITVREDILLYINKGSCLMEFLPCNHMCSLLSPGEDPATTSNMTYQPLLKIYGYEHTKENLNLQQKVMKLKCHNCYDTTTMIPIVESSNRVTIPTVVHVQDREHRCETVTICNTCKENYCRAD